MHDALPPPPDPYGLEFTPLPTPIGVSGHVRYTIAAFRRLRAWRSGLTALDLATREAVNHRDQALSDLGRAALEALPALSGAPPPSANQSGGAADATPADAGGESAPSPIAGPALHRFEQTIGALQTEQAQAETQRESLEIELAAAEADRRELLADFDARLDALDAELTPIEHTLEEHRRALSEAERAIGALTAQRRGLAQRQTRIDERITELSTRVDGDASAAEEIDRLRADQVAMAGQLAELDEALPAAIARRDAMNAPVDATREELTRLVGRRDALRAERRESRREADTRIAELRAEVAAAAARSRALGERHHAVLIDLGRALLHTEPTTALKPLQVAAEATLAELEHLARARQRLDEARRAFDGGPVRRTLTVGAVALVAVVILLLAI